MRTLRLTQVGRGAEQVQLALSGDEPLVARSSLNRSLRDSEREDLRWYLETYPRYPQQPAPRIAARVERWMADFGHELFHEVFGETAAARRIWQRLEPRLATTRIEISTPAHDTAALPWELLRSPRAGPLALRAHSFVRMPPGRRHSDPVAVSGLTRILMVISRPGGSDDVPLRSIAGRLAGIAQAAPTWQLDVVRPPTFDRLAAMLSSARAAGTPYRVVHFDGHGVWDGRGLLAFEDPNTADKVQRIDGEVLGRLLSEHDVPLLVLNACRSAHAEADARARAYGSLAQEVVAQGVPGVVAMGYDVYVDAAATFVGHLYRGLLQGRTLGEAVTIARAQLHDQPQRLLPAALQAHQDWCVPVAFESFPLRVASGAGLPRSIADDRPGPSEGDAEGDEVFLALSRAFTDGRVALLHGVIGSGKSATAAQFARWYVGTGGLSGPVVISQLTAEVSLARLLDDLVRATGDTAPGPLATDDTRRAAARSILERTPVLWIWDGVDTIAATAQEAARRGAVSKQLLAQFLLDTAATQAKFLLVSRGPELGWPGSVPRRVPMPPRPMTRQQPVLAPRLESAFQSTFTPLERDRLALLHLFQGSVSLRALEMMGQLEAGSIREIRGMSSRDWSALLERGSEAGLVTASGPHRFTLHPALPAHLRPLFRQAYGPADGPTALRAVRAAVLAITEVGREFSSRHQNGQLEAIEVLECEEANLLRTCELAREHGWWELLGGAVAGLRELYEHRGRHADWLDVIEQTLPDLADPATGEPLPGRQQVWSMITGSRAGRALRAQDSDEAERLHKLAYEGDRLRAAEFLDRPISELDDQQRNAIRNLAAAEQQRGRIQMERERPECLQHLQTAYELCGHIEDRPAQGTLARWIGNAHVQVPSLYDLDAAERWYQESFRLHAAAHDNFGVSRCYQQFGYVARERFLEAQRRRLPPETVQRLWDKALQHYRDALLRTSVDDVDDQGLINQQLGNLFLDAGEHDIALQHYRQSIHYFEVQGDLLGAGKVRANAAYALADKDCIEDALLYARAALADFESCEGDGAAEAVGMTRKQVADLDLLLRGRVFDDARLRSLAAGEEGDSYRYPG